MKAGRWMAIVLIISGICCVALVRSVRLRHAEHVRRTIVLRAVARSVGMCSLALAREGGPLREPLEGAAGGLDDMPGGYGLRESCDVVACPGIAGHPITVSVARAIH